MPLNANYILNIYKVWLFSMPKRVIASMVNTRSPTCMSVQIPIVQVPGPRSSTRQRPRLPRTVHSVVRRSKSIITAFYSSHHLLIPPVRRSTVDAKAFPVSGRALWNISPRLSSVFHSFVVVSKIICSCTCIQAPFNNCISFSLSWPRSILYCTWPR